MRTSSGRELGALDNRDTVHHHRTALLVTIQVAITEVTVEQLRMLQESGVSIDIHQCNHIHERHLALDEFINTSLVCQVDVHGVRLHLSLGQLRGRGSTRNQDSCAYLDTVVERWFQVRRSNPGTALDELNQMRLVEGLRELGAVVMPHLGQEVRTGPVILVVNRVTDIQHRIHHDNHLIVTDRGAIQCFAGATTLHRGGVQAVNTVGVGTADRALAGEAQEQSLVLEAGIHFVLVHFQVNIDVRRRAAPVRTSQVAFIDSICHILLFLLNEIKDLRAYQLHGVRANRYNVD
nr:MAG TPA: hypothetical protein [Caudoviricetes sp.]